MKFRIYYLWKKWRSVFQIIRHSTDKLHNDKLRNDKNIKFLHVQWNQTLLLLDISLLLIIVVHQYFEMNKAETLTLIIESIGLTKEEKLESVFFSVEYKWGHWNTILTYPKLMKFSNSWPLTLRVIKWILVAICSNTIYNRVLLSVHQYKKVAQFRASISVQCTDNEVSTDKFCTDCESDKEGLVIRTVLIMRP